MGFIRIAHRNIFQLLTGLIVIISASIILVAQTPQKTYASPEEAMQDLITATKAKDTDSLGRIFGPRLKDILATDPVQRKNEFEEFSEKITKKATLDKKPNGSYVVQIGDGDWPFPVPLVQRSGAWIFDTPAGVEEILVRRIGENELDTVLTCKVYAVAQWEYFLGGDWDNDLVHEFAQKFASSPGQKDGLYWPTLEGEEPSPLGPLVASARTEGYRAKDATGMIRKIPYHGYYFKILTAQGPSAPGGRFSYIINGNMIPGFALIAYPSSYGTSGVSSFIVNQQGRVYEKNLGSQTEAIVNAMTEYNPDKTWKPVIDE